VIVDAHAYVGPWAFRDLAHAEPDALLRRLDRAGVEQALVSATEGILYKDPQAANRRLAERLRGRRDRLLPLASLSPRLAGWQRDWRACLDELAPVGVRLHPSYHGYSLAWEEAGRLVEDVAATGAIVFVVVRIEDERVHHPLARVAAPPLEEVAAFLRAAPAPGVVLSGMRLREVEALAAQAPELTNYGVDISHLQHPLDALDRLCALLPVERIWLGSGAPFLMPEPAVYKVVMARLDEPRRQAILGGNAERAIEAARRRLGSEVPA
jgi:predicted TIM-barrel fold metal-dependent hydrolase